MKMLRCENCNAEMELRSYGVVVTCDYCGAQHVLDSLVKGAFVYDHSFLMTLLGIMRDCLNTEDLKEVCTSIKLNYRNSAFDWENIAGSTLQAKSRELVQLAQRRGMIDILVSWMMLQSREFALRMEALC